MINEKKKYQVCRRCSGKVDRDTSHKKKETRIVSRQQRRFHGERYRHARNQSTVRDEVRDRPSAES